MSIADFPSATPVNLVLGVPSLSTATAPEKGRTNPAEAPPARAVEALGLWLRWNEVYERVTATMFDERHDPKQLEQAMDLADDLRAKAVRMTQELLGG
jgi:hypothetical protein